VFAACGSEAEPPSEPDDFPVLEEPADITTSDVVELSVPALSGFEFEYEILDNTDTAFEARVRIINMNRNAIDGWKLSFDGDFTIIETRSAKLIDSENGNHTVINEFWTSAINPHSSAIFTFTAEKPTGAEILLENFALIPHIAPAELPAPPQIPAASDIPLNDETRGIREDERALRIGYQQGDSDRHVSRDLNLPSEGEHGSVISWFSSNEQIISNHGEIVNRPTGGFFPMTLTAVLQYGEYTMTKEFKINVAPLNNTTHQEMTMDILREINSRMPDITRNDDETVRQIEDNGTFDNPNNIISSFPVFGADDARALIDNYLIMFGINDKIDIRFESFRLMTRNNIFRFDQYYSDLRVYNRGMVVVADRETGHVINIGSGYILDFCTETTPNISFEEARQLIINEVYLNNLEQRNFELFIYLDSTMGIEAELAWGFFDNRGELEVALSAITGEIFFIDDSPSAGSSFIVTMLDDDRVVLRNENANINILGTCDFAQLAAQNTWKTYNFFKNYGINGYVSANSPIEVIINNNDRI
jgi:hypothetical protein